MKHEDILASLKNCELFSSLEDVEIRGLVDAISDSFQMQSFKAGEVVLNQGEYRTKLRIILDGQVLLQRAHQVGERTASTTVAILGKGRAMGWPAMLYGPRYGTVSAVCSKPSRIMSVDGEDLRNYLEQNPEVGVRVMQRLACMLGDRLRQVYQSSESHL